MATIICPNCGGIIEVDPSAVEDLARQLRDELFAHDLEERVAQMAHLHEAQVKTAREEERREADRRVADAETRNLQLKAQLAAEQQKTQLETERAKAASADEVAQLRTQLEAAAHELEMAVERERMAAQAQRTELEARVEDATRAGQLEAERVRAQSAEERARLQRQLDEVKAQTQTQVAEAAQRAQQREGVLAAEVAQLKAVLSAQEQTLQAQAQAKLVEATSELERANGELQAQLQVEQANSEQVKAALREEMARREGELKEQTELQLQARDVQIRQYKDEIDRLKDYRMRLSTKLIGESLERHCESEFNRIRMQAYPRALFEKDNVSVEGTKGDFIFRDYDDEGIELLSIMFEMKTEEEGSTNRKRNEDHFKKLDADRTKKNCEYAVLVSTLEPDNDFYNAGIADVSWQYPKMFVVRPQCFTTIIGLLKAAALAAHPYKKQLEAVRQEELDVTNFESKLQGIVSGIANDYELAAKNYEQAEKDIDAIIAKLKHLKGQLGTASKHFGTASKRGERLTVKRLTWGNQTMKKAFADAAAAAASAEEQDELADDEVLGEVVVEPDELVD